MTLEQIYALSVEDRIRELKRRTTPLPDAAALLADCDEQKHDIFDKIKRPDRKVQTKEEVKDTNGIITEPARYDTKPVNRIALPLEQDIVNIHTAFTVGTEPKISMQNNDESSTEVFAILRNILQSCKIKFQNKKAVRAWLAETECAEYWYAVQDESWWRRIMNVLKGRNSAMPQHKLKCVLWSPLRGDKLYPYFDDYGDLIALSREYKVAKDNTTDFTEKFMTIDKNSVIIYADGKVEKEFRHGFTKLPVIYMHRSEPLCAKIKPIRERLETLLSNFADCLDYNFAPKLIIAGEVQGLENRTTGSGGGDIIKMSENASAAYLTWQQSSEMAKLEFENLTERAYSLTNTPRISFENLKGLGNAFSGVAFKFAFMGTHMAVSNHAEVVEDFLQRRINFLLTAIGTLYPKYKSITENMLVDTEIIPYMIDNMAQSIDNAVRAVEGGVASKRTGIILAGLTDKVQEELDEINNAEINSKKMDIFSPMQ